MKGFAAGLQELTDSLVGTRFHPFLVWLELRIAELNGWFTEK